MFGIKSTLATILISTKLQDHNTFDNPIKIQPTTFKGFKIKNDKLN
ncbi:hypothetical protein GTZ96_014855 [Flavobacterium sp. BBQ-18]|nr:hypothetical protein [Flavobacterium undicola]